MKFIFWQNMLSIHQSAFIRNLSESREVLLVSEKDIDRERITHGWNIPNFGRTTVYIKPDDSLIANMLEDKDAIHIFTGINSFFFIYQVFKKAIKKNCKIMVQVEPYNYVDSKAWLRAIKYKILNLRYGSKIHGLLTISTAAKKCYLKAGFSENKLFDWAYFTETPTQHIEERNNHNEVNLLFVGSLDTRKNILRILPIIKKNVEKIKKVDIIGKGDLEGQILQFHDGTKINYVGAVANQEISKYFANADVLVLPSLYDGWGAVVNEALMLGTKVLCSDTSGASDLLRNNRGNIFSISKNNFEVKFLEIISEGPVDNNERAEIMEWAEKNISGKAASDYFVTIVNHIFSGHPKPIAPWL